MSEPTPPPPIPEIPFPYPPMREPPRRTEPLLVPLVDMPSSSPSPADRLFDRRTILVSGTLDHDAVTRLCAQLMALDGRSPAAVELLVSSEGGPAEAIGAVLDVLDLMRAPVNVTCTGTARGTAAILVTCGTGTRRAGRHATLSLRLPPSTVEGDGRDLVSRVAEHSAVHARLVAGVARATRQPADVVEAELERGGVRDGEAAVAFGLVDEVVAPARS